MDRSAIHSASFNCRDAAHYLSMAYAGTWGDGPTWALETAIQSLEETVKALGYDLVKREEKREAA